MLKRYYDNKINENLRENKVLVIYGPRQAGKTTLINNFLRNYAGKVFKSSGDDARLQSVLESSEFSRIIPFFSDYDLVVIDEAQRINNIGHGLKIIVDQIPGIKVIATGSSSFDLSNKIGEPLVGRQIVKRLYPLSASELADNFGRFYLHEQLENLLVYGSYPEIIKQDSFTGKAQNLVLIRDSYLYKDVLEFEQIKNSRKILSLLKLLAFQVGKEVSLNELGNSLQISKNTVERYLDLLEKSFVIFAVGGFSRNLRKEVIKTRRYYFFDTGIRNAVIDNLNPVPDRNDVGALWENFLVIERLKRQAYEPIYAGNYFWRTYDRKEIDWVEERDGKLFGYEFKWGDKKAKEPKLWKQTYANAEYQVIDRDNYFEFIM